jgi:prepilin-type N-terminal cleavage/methylation domain-containing protein
MHKYHIQGFSLLEMLVTLLMVSTAGLSLHGLVWQHGQQLVQQRLQATAVLQLRNIAQQLSVTPPGRLHVLLQQWQSQHQQALAGSVSQWQLDGQKLTIVLGWQAPGQTIAYTCPDDSLPVNYCLSFSHDLSSAL